MFTLKKGRKLSSFSSGEELCPVGEKCKCILWPGENCVWNPPSIEGMHQLPFWNYWHGLEMQKEVTLFKMLHCISSQCQGHCSSLNQSTYFGECGCAVFWFLRKRALGWVQKRLYIYQLPGINTVHSLTLCEPSLDSKGTLN